MCRKFKCEEIEALAKPLQALVSGFREVVSSGFPFDAFWLSVQKRLIGLLTSYRRPET
jgi:hypothetical protein